MTDKLAHVVFTCFERFWQDHVLRMVLLNHTVVLKGHEKLDLLQLWLIVLMAFGVYDKKFNIEGFIRVRAIVFGTWATA